MKRESESGAVDALRRRYEEDCRQVGWFPIADWETALWRLRLLEEVRGLLEQRAEVFRAQAEQSVQRLFLSAAVAGRKPLGQMAKLTPNRRHDLEKGAAVRTVPVDSAAGGTVAPLPEKRAEQITRRWRTAEGGDVLFARISTSIRAVRLGVVPAPAGELLLVSPEFFVLHARPGVLPEWLSACLALPSVRGELWGYCVGTSIERLPKEVLLQTALPAPPVPLQQAVLTAAAECREAGEGRARQAAAQAAAAAELLEAGQDILLSPDFLECPCVKELLAAVRGGL